VFISLDVWLETKEDEELDDNVEAIMDSSNNVVDAF
jgi:hypothetical protein